MEMQEIQATPAVWKGQEAWGVCKVAALPLVTKWVEPIETYRYPLVTTETYWYPLVTTETYWYPLLAKIRAPPSPPTHHSPGRRGETLVERLRDDTCSDPEVPSGKGKIGSKSDRSLGLLTWGTLWQWAPFPVPPKVAPGKAVELGDGAVPSSLTQMYVPSNPRQLAVPIPPIAGGDVLPFAISDCSFHWLNRILAVLLSVSRYARPFGLLEHNTRHWVTSRQQEFTAHGSRGCKSQTKARQVWCLLKTSLLVRRQPCSRHVLTRQKGWGSTLGSH